jgi:3-oxoisoapionate kinase
VTPMAESDLRLHLAKQTQMPMGLVDLTAFQSGCVAERLQDELAAGAKAVVFDGFADAMLDETAWLLWERALHKPIFAVGSSGLTYGLLRHWRKLGSITAAPHLKQPAGVDRLLVLSGSCSPVTEGQILQAGQQGFVVLHLEGPASWGEPTRQALEALARGQSVVLYTALGLQPKDRKHGEAFGTALGNRLRELLLLSGVRRVVVAGGDTSSHAVKQLGLDALTFAAPLAPGAPLCRCHASGSPLDGLELALKGGQVGSSEFFAQVRDGG